MLAAWQLQATQSGLLQLLAETGRAPAPIHPTSCRAAPHAHTHSTACGCGSPRDAGVDTLPPAVRSNRTRTGIDHDWDKHGGPRRGVGRAPCIEAALANGAVAGETVLFEGDMVTWLSEGEAEKRRGSTPEAKAASTAADEAAGGEAAQGDVAGCGGGGGGEDEDQDEDVDEDEDAASRRHCLNATLADFRSFGCPVPLPPRVPTSKL